MQSLGPMNVGVIGLGAGTLATYARPIDKYTFYEINPAVLKIAETEFTFLKFCLAPKEIVMGDARLSMETGPSRQFDVLAVDAFSGDAIPVHLLTREANALYWRHLKPDGILAVHVSNRHLSLAPAVALPAYDSATGLNRHWCVLWPLAGHAPHLGAIQRDLLSSPGGFRPRGPRQIRTRRFPPIRLFRECVSPFGTCCATQRSLGNMFARRLGVGHGSLLWFTSTRTAFAPPGPGCLPVPRLLSSYAVLRLPRFLRPRLQSALAFGLPRCGCLFFAAGACIPRTHRTKGE